MNPEIQPSTKAAGAGRSKGALRAVALALGAVLASGGGLAAWSATSAMPPELGVTVPRGPLLDRLMDQVRASPTQRAQARQIFDAADAELGRQRDAERADRARVARLFAQPTVDAAAVEALRDRIEQHHDLASRRATQALIDVGLVLTAQQRRTLASQLADGPRPWVVGPHHPHAALAAND